MWQTGDVFSGKHFPSGCILFFVHQDTYCAVGKTHVGCVWYETSNVVGISLAKLPLFTYERLNVLICNSLSVSMFVRLLLGRHQLDASFAVGKTHLGFRAVKCGML